jgi:hypothetical protein
MVASVEWRINDGTDAIVVVDAIALKVSEVTTLDAEILKDYLNVTGDLEAWRKWAGWQPIEGNGDPEAWGALIIGRNDDGEVFYVNPDLYWEGIRRWFRARGTGYNAKG